MADEMKYYLVKEIYRRGEWFEGWLTEEEADKYRRNSSYSIEERIPPKE